MDEQYTVRGFYLRIDTSPEGAQAWLFDIDDVQESEPLAEASAGSADAAVAALMSEVTFNFDNFARNQED
jgi:hypothetical protein